MECQKLPSNLFNSLVSIIGEGSRLNILALAYPELKRHIDDPWVWVAEEQLFYTDNDGWQSELSGRIIEVHIKYQQGWLLLKAKRLLWDI